MFAHNTSVAFACWIRGITLPGPMRRLFERVALFNVLLVDLDRRVRSGRPLV